MSVCQIYYYFVVLLGNYIAYPQCPDPAWNYFNESCFLYKNELHSWYSSREICRVLKNSDLASIHSEEENDFILSLVKENRPTWIGFNKFSSNALYKWSDGTQIDFERWKLGEPNNSYNGEKCAAFITPEAAWMDLNCCTSASYICQKNINKDHEMKPKCPLDWPEIGNKCYKIFWESEHHKNWHSAKSFCNFMGNKIHLARITSSLEQDFLMKLMKESNVNNLRIRRKIDLDYKKWNYWIDNSDGKYTNWDNEQLNSTKGKKLCTSMRSSGKHAGKWLNQNCTDIQAFICGGTKLTTTRIQSTLKIIIATCIIFGVGFATLITLFILYKSQKTKSTKKITFPSSPSMEIIATHF